MTSREQQGVRVAAGAGGAEAFGQGLTIEGSGCGDPGAEREVLGDVVAQVGDGIHFVNDPREPCWAAIVTALTSSPFAVMAAVFPPGQIPGSTTEPIALEAVRPRYGTWHLQDCCPLEADDPRRAANAFTACGDEVVLLPVARSVKAIRWTGSNLEAVRDFCGLRPVGSDHPDLAFLLPSEVSGSWRTPHVWHAGRRAWDPVPEGTWIVRDVTGCLEALDLATIRAKYLLALT